MWHLYICSILRLFTKFYIRSTGVCPEKREQSTVPSVAEYDTVNPEHATQDADASAAEDADVYLYISDHAIDRQYENSKLSSDTAVMRADFIERLSIMSDDDFVQQFQVRTVRHIIIYMEVLGAFYQDNR